MFLLTSLTWFIVSLFAAMPFTLYHGIGYTDAFFETMSGITTTGSTVLSGLDSMDHSILVWRSLLQWLGGIGFIVMAVAILPFLNVGGCGCSEPNPQIGPTRPSPAPRAWPNICFWCIWG